MAVIPHRFLFHLCYPCRHIKDAPVGDDGDDLVNLPEECRIENFAGMDGLRNFAEIRVGWNEQGIAVQVEVRSKEEAARGDAAHPRFSDGMTLWIDTRDARTAHRASRYCHMFHFLAAGGGTDRDEPVFLQGKISRALEDAPQCAPEDVPFRCEAIRGGYRLAAFLPAGVLNGFDPDQNRRLGFFYACRDAEKGEQLLAAAPEFPYWEDPSLWCVLELV